MTEYYSTQEAAQLLGVSIRRMNALAKNRNLGVIKAGARFFSSEELASLRERRPGHPQLPKSRPP